MRITIDTKEDSREEIKRTIHFLSALLGENVHSNVGSLDSSSDEKLETKDIFEDNSGSDSVPSSGNALTSLFGNDSSSSDSLPSSTPSDSEILEDTESEEKVEPEDQVQFIY